MRNLKYKHEFTWPIFVPMGKLPFIKFGEDIADSGLIIKYIEKKIGVFDSMGQSDPDTKSWQRYTEDFF